MQELNFVVINLALEVWNALNRRRGSKPARINTLLPAKVALMMLSSAVRYNDSHPTSKLVRDVAIGE